MKEPYDKRTETHACDLISRQAAIDAVQQHREGVLGGYEYDEGVAFVYAAAHNHIIDVIKHLPSVQPDIVACGDCIHWICHDRRCRYWNHGVKPLDWCCHAERRTNG